jgi:hypothetical protein
MNWSASRGQSPRRTRLCAAKRPNSNERGLVGAELVLESGSGRSNAGLGFAPALFGKAARGLPG